MSNFKTHTESFNLGCKAGYRDAIHDARERFTAAIESIESVREWYADVNHPSHQRLTHKLEGVELALSYLDDLERLNG